MAGRPSNVTIYDPSAAAEATGLSLDALRYYEREGLIGPIRRSTGGHRQYDDDDLGWIGIVTCLRDAGLGIADLRRFTSLLRVDGVRTDRVTFLRERRAELEERVRLTQAALKVLDGKIAHYSAVDGVAVSADPAR
jgi:DNA-binding transcriptional MerR regulator